MNRLGTVGLLCAVLIGAAGMNAWSARENGEARPGRFAVCMVAADGTAHWYGIRYDISTGQSHEMIRGAWVAIEGGPEKKQRGSYTVEIIPTHNAIPTRAERFAAVLLNTETGQSWHINDGRWLPVAEE